MVHMQRHRVREGVGTQGRQRGKNLVKEKEEKESVTIISALQAEGGWRWGPQDASWPLS